MSVEEGSGSRTERTTLDEVFVCGRAPESSRDDLRDNALDVRFDLVERASVLGEFRLVVDLSFRLRTATRKDERGVRDGEGVVGSSDLRSWLSDEILQGGQSQFRRRRRQGGERFARGRHSSRLRRVAYE